MTKREAKRLVCRVYATTIQSDFELDAEWLRENLKGEEYSEDDKSRIMSACYELQNELFDRGEGWYGEEGNVESRGGLEPRAKSPIAGPSGPATGARKRPRRA